jgi:ATP phosphoribosyltransferase regulatory subunit HisZ
VTFRPLRRILTSWSSERIDPPVLEPSTPTLPQVEDRFILEKLRFTGGALAGSGECS